jgi:enoyl-[acyl-carrier protein] reductase I
MLSVDLRGKKAFVAGIGDDRGFGWAIAKALHFAGATVFAGTWPPMLNIFTTAYLSGKFDESRRHPDGSMLEFQRIYPLDAQYDVAEDVPLEVRENKRYKDVQRYTIAEVANLIQAEQGSIDILVHSLANGPEVKKPLIETSRKGYLEAVSASTYSFVSLVTHFGPLMSKGGSFLNLTYLASEKVIPGYGGGMSSAKAALESDTRTLAFEAGRRFGVRVNGISAGAYGSRAARAIGFIDKMIVYSENNSPLGRAVDAKDIGNCAAFLASDLAAAITGEVIHVDCGLHAMGLAIDSTSLASPQE